VVASARFWATVLLVVRYSRSTQSILVDSYCLERDVNICIASLSNSSLTFRPGLVTLLLSSSAGHAPGLRSIAEISLPLFGM
jgi:hypothetical protein